MHFTDLIRRKTVTTPLTKSVATDTHSRKKAHIRQPRPLVSSRMLEYRTRRKQSTFEEKSGHIDPQQ